MERTLLLLSFGLGTIVWLCGYLSSAAWPRVDPNAPKPMARFWAIACVAVSIVVFLITLPSAAPLFAPGHGFGTGFLVGGLLGLLASWTIIRALAAAEKSETVSSPAAIAGPIGLALAASTLPSLLMRASLTDALCGIAIGWLTVTLFILASLASQWQTRVTSTANTCLALSAAAAVLFCTLAGLGELRGLVDLVGTAVTIVHWSAPGLAFTACVVVALLVVLLPPTLTMRIPLVARATALIERGRNSDEARSAVRRAWRMGLCALATLIVGRVVSGRFAEEADVLWKTRSPLLKPLFAILGPSPLFHVVVIAVVAALALCWLVRDQAVAVAPQVRAAQTPPPPNFLAALTLVAAAMAAFQLMGGFGVAVTVTVVLLFTALTTATVLTGLHEYGAASGEIPPEALWRLPAAQQMVRLLLLGGILALFRFLYARYESDLRGVGLTDHYALFGILLGAAFPPFLAAFYKRVPVASSDSDAGRLLRLCVTGLLVLVVPALLVALWGSKCVVALLIGLALSVLFDGSMLTALLALAVALAVTQWTHHMLPLAQLTRDQKVSLLSWSCGITVVALLVAEHGSRIRSAASRRRLPARGSAK